MSTPPFFLVYGDASSVKRAVLPRGIRTHVEAIAGRSVAQLLTDDDAGLGVTMLLEEDPRYTDVLVCVGALDMDAGERLTGTAALLERILGRDGQLRLGIYAAPPLGASDDDAESLSRALAKTRVRVLRSLPTAKTADDLFFFGGDTAASARRRGFVTDARSWPGALPLRRYLPLAGTVVGAGAATFVPAGGNHGVE